MIAIPAVDLRGGACVQLVGGSYDHERLRFDDPHGVARGWAQLGFTRLHLVDLDAATGRGSNEDLIAELLRDREANIQVVVGTRAIEEPGWIDAMASLFPGELLVAADVRDRSVVTRGWERMLARNVLDVVEELNALPLAGVMVTAVHREGQLAGTDLFLMEDVADASEHPVYASGGITTYGDPRALEDRGLAGAIIGMALYTGVLDARLIADEFTEELVD